MLGLRRELADRHVFDHAPAQRAHCLVGHGDSEAEVVEGPRIKARLAAPGSDWMRVSDDGFWRPDVRMPFQTDDGETVLMHYTGLVQQTDTFKQAAEANQPTEWNDQYMRLTMHFDTGAERYRWLNTSLFVAKGRLLGTGSIEYAVYRIT
jgi:hypothetical protein